MLSHHFSCVGATFCSGGVLGVVNCFFIIRASAVKSAAAVMAEVVPMMSHACHAGIVVSRYLREPIRIKRAADPASEMPSDIRIALIMLVIKSFLMRFLKSASAFWVYSLSAALTSSSRALITSFNENFSDI
jgi:hypothetical protein